MVRPLVVEGETAAANGGNSVNVSGPFELVCRVDDEKAWRRARLTGLGASDMAAVLGEDPHKSALKIYAEKVGRIDGDDLADVEAVEWGKELEPVIIRMFTKRTGRRAYPSGELLRSSEHPWALATLDARNVVQARTMNDGCDAPLEIKTASAFISEQWEDGPPPHYLIQVHHQMLVTGAEFATIACLLGGQRLVWCDVERDETLIRKIIHNGERFWDRIQRKDPPDPDGSEATRAALHSMFPKDDGETVALSGELIQIVDEWRALKDQKKAAEKRITLLENEIKATLGAATLGLLPNNDAISWKAQKMAARSMPETSARVLRFHPAKMKLLKGA